MTSGTNGKSKDIVNKKIPYPLQMRAKYSGYVNVKRTELSAETQTRKLMEQDMQTIMKVIEPSHKQFTLDRIVPIFVRVSITIIVLATIIFALLYVVR